MKTWTRDRLTPKETIFATFDTETDSLGGTLTAGTVCHPDGTSHFFSGNPDTICGLLYDQMWKQTNTRHSNVVWFAHYAQYDWRYLLRYALKQSDWFIDVSMRTDTDMYQITIKRMLDSKRYEKIIMRDSYALFNTSLAAFTKQFSPDLQKMELDLERETFDPTNPQHQAYALRDVESLRIALGNFDKALHDDYGIHVKATFASTALAAWQQTLAPGVEYFGSEGLVEQVARDAYFGGIVFLTDTRPHRSCATYDINSSYPHTMRTRGVPCGKVAETTVLQFEFPAFYKVTVRAPDDLIIPILPHRVGESIRWASGVFTTTVSNAEISFALEHGYELLQVHSGLQFERLEFPFTDFVTKSETIRTQNKKQARETVAKFMQNSLYGKYGSKRERKQMNIISEGEYPEEGWIPFDEEGRLYVSTERQEDMQIRVEWAAWITAQSRLHLLRTAYTVGVDRILYGDTDSLTILGETDQIDVGTHYGQWKLEKQWVVFRAIAPKVYAGIILDDGIHVGPQLIGAAKGIPKKVIARKSETADGITGREIWVKLLEGEQVTVHYDSISSLLLSLKPAKRDGNLFDLPADSFYNEINVKPANRKERKSTDLSRSANYEQITGTQKQGGRVRPRRVG